MLKRKTVIGAKVESSYGVAETITASECFLAYDVNFKPDIDALDRNPMADSLGQLAPQKGARRGSVSFSTDIYGSGTAGTIPSIDALLRACGMAATTEATVQVLYQPTDDSLESATICVWQDGLKHILNGSRGKFSIKMDMGQRGKIDWTFEAKDFTYTDENAPDGVYSTVVPPVCLNQSFSVSGYSAVLPSLQFDVNNDLQRAPDVNATGGYARVDITGRTVEGSFSPETTVLATNDYYTPWQGGTKSDVRITLGSTAGNIIKIMAPNVHYTGLTFEDRAGILAHALAFRCAELVVPVSGGIDSGTVAGTIRDTSLFDENDEYNGCRLTLNSGTYVDKARLITDVVASTGDATLEAAFPGAPEVGGYFTISKKELQILFK